MSPLPHVVHMVTLTTGLGCLGIPETTGRYLHTCPRQSPDTVHANTSFWWKEIQLTAPLWPVYFRNGDPVSGSHIRAVPSGERGDREEGRRGIEEGRRGEREAG